jgi:hypothetical protein
MQHFLVRFCPESGRKVIRYGIDKTGASEAAGGGQNRECWYVRVRVCVRVCACVCICYLVVCKYSVTRPDYVINSLPSDAVPERPSRQLGEHRIQPSNRREGREIDVKDVHHAQGHGG